MLVKSGLGYPSRDMALPSIFDSSDTMLRRAIPRAVQMSSRAREYGRGASLETPADRIGSLEARDQGRSRQYVALG